MKLTQTFPDHNFYFIMSYNCIVVETVDGPDTHKCHFWFNTTTDPIEKDSSIWNDIKRWYDTIPPGNRRITYGLKELGEDWTDCVVYFDEALTLENPEK